MITLNDTWFYAMDDSYHCNYQEDQQLREMGEYIKQDCFLADSGFIFARRTISA